MGKLKELNKGMEIKIITLQQKLNEQVSSGSGEYAHTHTLLIEKKDVLVENCTWYLCS